MTDKTAQLQQQLEKLTQRVEDIAAAVKKLWEEESATTEMCRDNHFQLSHCSGCRKPQLNRSTPFEG